MALTTQEDFARALLQRDRPIPPGLTCRNGLQPARRFAVHRNNVVASLIAALAARFPVTKKIVGAVFFAELARVFIDRHPPRSPILALWGEELAGFVERFEPASSLPYLADVVRLEAARGRAYHAADAPPLDPEALATVLPERLPGLGFVVHPAVSIVRSSHPIVTIWAMNADEAGAKPIASWIGEDALVTRPMGHVLVHRLPSGGGDFLSALAAGATFGDAVETASSTAPAFDLATNVALMLRSGVVTATH